MDAFESGWMARFDSLLHAAKDSFPAGRLPPSERDRMRDQINELRQASLGRVCDLFGTGTDRGPTLLSWLN